MATPSSDTIPPSIEERTVRVEEARLRLESRFAHRHLATILTGLISAAAIFVSMSQMSQTDKQALAARELQDRQHTAEMAQQAAQAEKEWQLGLLDIVLQHAGEIFSADAEKRQRAQQILDATLPQDRKQQLFSAIERASVQSAAREGWKEAAAGVDSAVLITKPDSARLRERFQLVRLETGTDANITEATSMLGLLGQGRISMATSGYVSKILSGGYEVTIWPGTYGRLRCYGVRYGLPLPGRPYFGSNDTYFEVCKD